MILKRTDLPLDSDAHSRFLPWLIAFMIILAVFGLALMLVLNEVAKRWDKGVVGTVSIQIPVTAEPLRDEVRLDEVLKALALMDKIESYEVMSTDKLMNLLKPWLGNVDESSSLPLPQLVDVKFGSSIGNEAKNLSEHLNKLVPGVIVDDHQIWLARLVDLMKTIEALACTVLTFVILATIGTVIFTTKTGLAIHREAIEVLHLIGAQDSYVARQFANKAFALGLKGGIYGLILGVPPLIGTAYIAMRMEDFFFTNIELDLFHWTVIGALPLFVALIAMITARITVMRSLARML